MNGGGRAPLDVYVITTNIDGGLQHRPVCPPRKAKQCFPSEPDDSVPFGRI